MKRFNITLPDNLAEKIKDVPNKSSLITEALQAKLKEITKKKLNILLIEGYKATKREDKTVNNEWDKITLKGWK